MTVGREWKLILLFTLPIMAGSFLQQLYNTVRWNRRGQICRRRCLCRRRHQFAPLVFLFLAFAMGLSVGAGVTVSQYFGARKMEELVASIDTALILMGVFGVCFCDHRFCDNTVPLTRRTQHFDKHPPLQHSLFQDLLRRARLSVYLQRHCLRPARHGRFQGDAVLPPDLNRPQRRVWPCCSLSPSAGASPAQRLRRSSHRSSARAFPTSIFGNVSNLIRTASILTAISAVISCASVSRPPSSRRFSRWEGSAMQRLVNGFGESATAAYAAALAY